MGREKALLEIGGETLIVRMAQLVESVAGGATVVGASASVRALGLRSIADDWPGAGPLGGIATALRRVEGAVESGGGVRSAVS